MIRFISFICANIAIALSMVSPFNLIPGSFKAIRIDVIILFIMAILLLMSDFLFGALSPLIFPTIVAYSILFILSIRLGKFNVNELRKRPKVFQNLLFGVALMIVIAFALQSSGILSPGLIASTETSGLTFAALIGGSGIVLVSMKAFIEEVVFRGALPKTGLGDIGSNLAFGLFHVATLTARAAFDPTFSVALIPVAVLLLVGLGFVWTFFRNSLGLMGAVGGHIGWNLAALGAGGF